MALLVNSKYNRGTLENLFDITAYQLNRAPLSELSNQSGMFLAGECPCTRPKNASAELNFLKSLGVKNIFSLITETDKQQLGVKNLFSNFGEFGFSVTHFPIRDRSIPNFETHERLRLMLLKMQSCLTTNTVFYLHCQAGLGRTGLVTALFLRQIGISPTNAIEIVRLRRPGSIETMEQENFVRNFRI